MGGRHTERPKASAELIARALVIAADVTGELGRLRFAPSSTLSGDLPLKARWIALAALIARPEGFDRDALGRALGCREWIGGLALARCQAWWFEQRVHGVLVALDRGVR